LSEIGKAKIYFFESSNVYVFWKSKSLWTFLRYSWRKNKTTGVIYHPIGDLLLFIKIVIFIRISMDMINDAAFALLMIVLDIRSFWAFNGYCDIISNHKHGSVYVNLID